MKRTVSTALALASLSLLVGRPTGIDAACCYFSAKDKDVLQPAQKAFITWDEAEKIETFTVQPRFEGNAADFGMVIPTPGKPKLDEMPRDFFKELAVFTILEPMDLRKYKPMRLARSGARADGPVFGAKKSTVKVLEAGVVGSLDYKVITAEKADDLYGWLKENQYAYAGDEATLDHYIRKAWFFTVMKIDAKQMKPRADGSYDGEVTPTRFTFTSEKLVYPLRITQISVKDQTEALFYVQAAGKVDLPGDFSHQYTFVPMWSQATGFAVPEMLTAQEKQWHAHVQGQSAALVQKVGKLRQAGHEPATLEWAKKLTEADLQVLTGERPFNRAAPKEDVEKLKLLKGHLRQGKFVTKMRKVFRKEEMGDDLEFVTATVGGKADEAEYFSILPTSPP